MFCIAFPKSVNSKSPNDLEDAVQYMLATQSRCDCIITNDASFYLGEIDIFTYRRVLHPISQYRLPL